MKRKKNRCGTLHWKKIMVEGSHQTTGNHGDSPESTIKWTFLKENEMSSEVVYKVVRCQGDVKIDRGMDEQETINKALEIGNAEDVCTCESEEDGLKTLQSFKNSLSYFTSSSTRYANCIVFWLVKQEEEEGEIEFIETADWE